MTQEEAIDRLCDVIEVELERINVKLQALIDIYREGVTVYVEKVDKE